MLQSQLKYCIIGTSPFDGYAWSNTKRPSPPRPKTRLQDSLPLFGSHASDDLEVPPTARDERGTFASLFPTRHLSRIVAGTFRGSLSSREKTPPRSRSCGVACEGSPFWQVCCHNPCLGSGHHGALEACSPAAGGMAPPNHQKKPRKTARTVWSRAEIFASFCRWPVARRAELPDAWHGGAPTLACHQMPARAAAASRSWPGFAVVVCHSI